MNREDYRAQVDAVPFSPDFQDRTMARLSALAREKETKTMKKTHLRTGLIAAALAAVMVVGACAAAVLLNPQDVARHVGNEALAAAFENGGAVTVNETQTVGSYDVTFMGLASGEGLSGVEGLDGVAQDQTYAVLAYARADGTAITEDVPELTVSPLVEGCAPWQVNAWTLGGAVHSFAQDGVLYYLLECDSMEPFADHAVYLAVYPGTHTPPDAGTFGFDEGTGAITVKEGKDAAMFTLPLDPAKADPEKAQALLDGMFWAQPETAEPPAEDLPADLDITFSADPDQPGEVVILEDK